MGLFKQMKDMKNMVAAAPEMITNAQALAGQAQQLQHAQMAAMQAGTMPGMPGVGTPPDAAKLTPIAGVSIALYAQLSKTIGEQRLDADGITRLMTTQGLTYAQWDDAYAGWNERFKADMALSSHFAMLFQQSTAL
jgi:hypothetical protein